MTRLGIFTGKRLLKRLQKQGFQVIRVRGSHHYLQHQDGRATVVPVHAGEAIGRGLLHKILKDCELTESDLD